MSTSNPLIDSSFPIDKIRYNAEGRVAAVIQDYLEGQILTLVWMNSEAVQKTVETRQVWCHQGSGVQVWQSGLGVMGLGYEEKTGAIWIGVDGQKYNQNRDFTESIGNTLSGLFKVICDRRDHPKSDSYTCKLMAGGDNKILKKIGEESAEVVMAFKDDEKESITGEVADLFYHTLVALAYHHVDLRDVYRKLEERRR